jgi:hypothetical protein
MRAPAEASTFAGGSEVDFLAATGAAEFAAAGHFVDGGPRAGLGLLMTHSLLLVAFLNVFGLALLFVCVTGFGSAGHKRDELFGSHDDAAGHARPGVAGRLRGQVIGIRVDDDGAAENGSGPVELDFGKVFGEEDMAHGIGLHIAKVADVTMKGVRPAMFNGGGIKVTARGRSIRRRAIALLVDVKAVQSGRESGEHGHDAGFVSAPGEGDGAFHFGIGGGR